MRRLYEATRRTLTDWTDRLRAETGDAFPEKVTAFRDGMAVHGRYGQPCPVCGTPVQRIVYAANEANYCATCQTGGRLLADRSLSRLLRRGLAEDPRGSGAAPYRVAGIVTMFAGHLSVFQGSPVAPSVCVPMSDG